jgi:hypothetical protein
MSNLKYICCLCDGDGPVIALNEQSSYIEELEKALSLAADDLDKAANQFEGLKGGLPIKKNPEIFRKKALRARSHIPPPE